MLTTGKIKKSVHHNDPKLKFILKLKHTKISFGISELSEVFKLPYPDQSPKSISHFNGAIRVVQPCRREKLTSLIVADVIRCHSEKGQSDNDLQSS